VGLFLVVRKLAGRNVEFMRVHFENVIGVRRIVAVTGTDGGNEEAIIGLSEGLEEFCGFARMDVLKLLIGLACLGRVGYYLHNRMETVSQATCSSQVLLGGSLVVHSTRIV
jgi:hypothetical protein